LIRHGSAVGIVPAVVEFGAFIHLQIPSDESVGGKVGETGLVPVGVHMHYTCCDATVA